MHRLQVLSVARIPSCVPFVCKLITYLCCDMQEISLANYGKLTDGSLEAISTVWCSVNALILDNLSLLTGTKIVFLIDGSWSIQIISFKRCSFKLVNDS